MKTALIGLGIGVLVGVAIAATCVLVEDAMKRRRARRVQAEWEAHVADAVRLSETPLYDRVAAELARNLDDEWAAMNRQAGRG